MWEQLKEGGGSSHPEKRICMRRAWRGVTRVYFYAEFSKASSRREFVSAIRTVE